MPDMILLGAGASRDADIPTAYEMSIRISEEITQFARRLHARPFDELERFAMFVAGGMLLRQGSMGENPFYGVNVEELFQALQMLREKDRLVISGLVTWHPEIEALWRKKSEYGTEPYENFFRDLERLFARALINLTNITDPATVAYLQPLLRPLSHQSKLVIATLNYDRSFEIMADAHSELYTSVVNDFTVLQNQGLFLLKVHGSIDWQTEYTTPSTSAPIPIQTIRQATATEMGQPGYAPGIIFGAGNKLTAKGPYLELLRAFQQELAAATTLTVVGYSFSDEHINEFIGRWLNADVTHILKVVDPRFPQANDFSQFLHRECAGRINHISQSASTGLAIAFP